MYYFSQQKLPDRSKGRGRLSTSSTTSNSGNSTAPKNLTEATAAKDPEDEAKGKSSTETTATKDPEDKAKGKSKDEHTALPYLWQYRLVTKSSQLQSNDWNDFPDDVNAKIEESCSNPKNERYRVNISDDVYQIAFTNEGIMKARRVLTSSSKFSWEGTGEGGRACMKYQPNIV